MVGLFFCKNNRMFIRLLYLSEHAFVNFYLAVDPTYLVVVVVEHLHANHVPEGGVVLVDGSLTQDTGCSLAVLIII